MFSLAPERCKGLVRRELGFVSFLLLWLLYWNLFNKGYIKKKKKKSYQTPGRSRSWRFLHFPSARYLIFFTSSNGAFPEVPLQSQPLIGSRFFVLPDILANLTFTQKKAGNNQGKKSKEGMREGRAKRASLRRVYRGILTFWRLDRNPCPPLCVWSAAASCEASKKERKRINDSKQPRS